MSERTTENLITDQATIISSELNKNIHNKNIAAEIDKIAIESLSKEALLSPKPGLVDRHDTGAHTDMDIRTFLDSAMSLQGYIGKCFLSGFDEGKHTGVFDIGSIRATGIEYEKKMFEATGGINTHKGAVFTFGIISAALGYKLGEGKEWTLPDIQEGCMMIAAPLADELGIDDSNGSKIYKKHGIKGVKGEALRGFPSVLITSFDALSRAAKIGLQNDAKWLFTLLVLMSEVDDTNVVSRCGIDGLTYIRSAAKSCLKRIEEETTIDMDRLNRMNADFIERNLSPGGCADILSASMFVEEALTFRNTGSF